VKASGDFLDWPVKVWFLIGREDVMRREKDKGQVQVEVEADAAAG